MSPDSVFSDKRDYLLRQSGIARSLGSPFVGDVLAAARRQLFRASELEALIAGWPGDPAASAMSLRLNAGLHALARRGTFPDLSALYAGIHQDFDRAVGEALELGERTLLVWMGHPTQTNEVRRSSAFMAALAVLANRYGLPVELLEIGASAGLNLLLDNYGHNLGGHTFGDPASPLQLAPQWQGAAPPQADVRIASARGVDLRPLRLDDPHTRERLMSYVWPGDEVRSECLSQAMLLARDSIPVVDRANAVTWLADRLAQPQAPGTVRVVQHSMVMQYLPEEDLHAARDTIRAAGRRATPDRPLARMGLEWDLGRTEVSLTLSHWCGDSADGERITLAICHPYGASIDWHGPSAST
ncbi:DUF2332 domain-containing protein [Novosphingobium album (ex Hu et al. 2023)]|uniref:DUF2332 family protein n=1 Tax=Novosphingobium album (ex Hu et al. 2023) TaxID=2930093 RepID=A0ABT0B4K4_9SPHN|nr:DUF2332 family protein [Novosphingobium album (ex Hu et al. 2023)]MCJ2179972.1 DUF2332 family protein [Novosphingobium album (ex Hu et al. 2023)]